MPSAAPSAAMQPAAETSRDWRSYRRMGALLVVAVCALLLILAPLQVSPYWLRILSLAFMFATLTQAINLIAGFTGYFAFGNVVFFGLGAYSVAVIMVKANGSFLLSVLAAVLISVMAALLVGPPLLRLRGHYFAIATVGLNEMVKAVVANLTLTGAGMGLSLPLPPWNPSDTARVFYYFLLASMFGSIGLAVWFKWSRLGYICRAIRDDELKAESMGLPTTAVKTAAWAVSAALTGLVGATYAYWYSYVEPPAVFDMLIAVKSFVIFLLGGAGTIFGPIIAAFFVECVSTVLWVHLLDYHLGALGLGVLLIALYMPKGIAGFLREHRRFFAAKLQR